jgi:hypothetical protein
MAHLKIPENERHYWSPQLTLQVEKRGDGSYIRGLYGPNPTVWTMFVFFYTLFAVIGLIGTIFGLSQLQLGYPAWALWALPISLVAIAALYLAARRGQRIGSQPNPYPRSFLAAKSGANLSQSTACKTCSRVL